MVGVEGPERSKNREILQWLGWKGILEPAGKGPGRSWQVKNPTGASRGSHQGQGAAAPPPPRVIWGHVTPLLLGGGVALLSKCPTDPIDLCRPTDPH